MSIHSTAGEIHSRKFQYTTYHYCCGYCIRSPRHSDFRWTESDMVSLGLEHWFLGTNRLLSLSQRSQRCFINDEIMEKVRNTKTFQ
jgi:hypothetical protein